MKVNFVQFKKLPGTKAWKATSKFVRLYSGGVCYTCGARVPFEKLHAGHFREKIGNAAGYFNLDGLRAQCFRCNRRLHGAKDMFAFKLRNEIGNKRFNELFRESQKSKKWTKEELKEIAEERERQIKKLKSDAEYSRDSETSNW